MRNLKSCVDRHPATCARTSQTPNSESKMKTYIVNILKGRQPMLNLNLPRWGARFSLVTATVTLLLLCCALMNAQTTVQTGSIVGTVTDASGAVLEGAKVTITNTDTNRIINLTTNSSGAYNSGALAPGNYKVQVSSKGFSGFSQTVPVQVGNTATANARLQIGQ